MRHTEKGGAESQIVVDHTWMYARFSSEAERRKKKWKLPRCIIVEFEQRNGEELHVFGNGKYLCVGRDHVGVPRDAKKLGRDRDILRSGICTRKSFLHSLGLVM